MVTKAKLLRPEMVSACELISKQKDIHGRRASALLAINDGKTIAAAAVESGLTRGQVTYLLSRFRSLGMDIFPKEATAVKKVKSEKVTKRVDPAELKGDKKRKKKEKKKKEEKLSKKAKEEKTLLKKEKDKEKKKTKKKAKDDKKRLNKEKKKDKKKKKEKKKKAAEKKRKDKKSGKKKKERKKEKKKK